MSRYRAVYQEVGLGSHAWVVEGDGECIAIFPLGPKARENALRVCDAMNAADELRRDCAEAYQVLGSILLSEPAKYHDEDIQRALDNLLAAASGEPRPHDDLLPWPKNRPIA